VIVQAFRIPPIGDRDYFRFLAIRVGRLSPWRSRLAAFVLGALAALAFPPLHLVPLFFLAVTGLVWLHDGKDTRRGTFANGWWWGLGHFSIGLYWISNSMLVDPARFGWMIPFAIFGLGGVLALFPALVMLLLRLSGTRGPARVLVLAGLWTLAEWVRGWILTGFPWNLAGSIWDVSVAMLQPASVLGAFGLSLLTMVAAAAPAVLADEASAWRRYSVLGFGAALLGGMWAYGHERLAEAPTGFVEGVRLRLVQANIPQSNKWQEEQRQRNLDDHVALSRSAGFERITHVVWPETAATYYLDHDPVHRSQIAQAAPAVGSVITGAPRVTAMGQRPFRLWNSIQAVDPQARIIATYDKVHLVPFGEYVPLRDILPISKITPGAIDFSSGDGHKVLLLPGLPPMGPLVCYEAIFPGEVVGEERPEWLLNLTNDGWFGISTGPYQHLASARLRAVEEGLPLVRAGNTGISAVFDPYGREVARLGLGERGVLDVRLPKTAQATYFSANGVGLSLLLAGLLVLIGRGLSTRR
jgi:apolipoprotein N-acyltransferase